MNYAQTAIDAIKTHLSTQDARAKKARIHQSEIMAINLATLDGIDDWDNISNGLAICQCFGCRQRLSPTLANDLTAGEARELIKQGKLYCKNCQKYGRSLALEKLLECFPRAFVDGKFATDTSKLPQEAFKKVTTWIEENCIKGNSTNSLYIHGKTGAGKSRILTLGALRMLEYGITINCIRGGGFSAKLREFAEDGNIDRESAWLSNLTRSNVLIFDDFGKDKLTETMADKLWRILDERLGNRTTIFATNFDLQNLKIDDTLKRRIIDYTDNLAI